MSSARHLYGQLSSNDCSEDSSVPAKFWLQEAYDKAYVAHNQCLARWQSEEMNVLVPSMGAPAPAPAVAASPSAAVAASPSAALLQAPVPAAAAIPVPAAA